MGNTVNDRSEHVFTSIGKDYEQMQHDSRGIVLRHKQNQETFLLK